MEVWIEILKSSQNTVRLQSLPLWKCGLKSYCSKHGKNKKSSLPLRKCGLKSEQYIIGNEPSGHFPCGSVDWNDQLDTEQKHCSRHFPCGSVDWNSIRIPFTVYSWPSLPSRKCGLKYWAVLHMGIRGVSAIIINIIKTYWNPWICLIFIFTSWEIPMQLFCWRIVLIQKVFRIYWDMPRKSYQ